MKLVSNYTHQSYFHFHKKNVVASVLLGILISFSQLVFANDNCAVCPTGNIFYVNQNVATPGDGSSWANAFAEFRDAIDESNNCPNVTEIWVAAGTYKPHGATNQIEFFIMKNNMAWFGGFNGTETSLSQRDWKANPTILSGDLLGDDDFSVSPPGNMSDNSYHVIFNFNTFIDSTAVLDGFHITSGNSNVAPPNHVGGGLYNKQASPTVKNCMFYGNNAGYGGGGNYNDKSTISLENCIFYNNTGAYRGGAMYSDASTMKVRNCTFFDNHAIIPGMGVGGAMFNNFSHPIVVNCSFLKNTATHGGGAISNNAWAKPKFYNSIFWDNQDEFANTSADPNSAAPETNSNNTVHVQNCIIQNSGNSGTNWNEFYGIDLGGNSQFNPEFVDPINGDMHLQNSSPAINTGENALTPIELVIDLDGNPRIYDFVNGGIVDLGAFEYQGVPLTCTVGAPCNDSDPCTQNEVFQPDCSCGGGTLVDDDQDGLCDSDPLDNCIGPNIGDACDDGVACTVGETIQANCDCAGGTTLDDDQDGLCDLDPADNCFGPNIGGNCDDGDDCTLNDVVQNDCTCLGTTLLDNDNDGLCDNDPADNCVGPNIGESCDDGDECTTGEIVQNDCTCSGGVLLDDDNDNLCDTDPADNCIGPNIGDVCDDSDPETIDDVVGIDCICLGTTDTNDLNNKTSVKIFPNPTHDLLFLSIENYEGGEGDLKVFNVLGQEMHNQKFDAIPTTSILIDVENFDSGVYIIMMKLENKATISRKFVVSK